MKSPWQVVLAADELIQRGFNATVYAVMRRFRLSKRTLRRNGWAILLILRAMDAISLSIAWYWAAAMVALVGLSWWIRLRWDDESDAATEHGSVRSTADAYGSLWKGIGLIETCGLAIGLARFARFDLPETVCACVLLFQGYLCGTNPTAPKKAEKRASLFAAQRSEA